MTGEYRGGKEKEWQMEGLRRFHGFKLGMPKRPVPNAEDRSAGRCYIWTPENELFGRLSRVSSDRLGTLKLGKDNIHLPGCQLPLHHDAFWA